MFKEAALNNHFVCANWKAFDEIQGNAHQFREELLNGGFPGASGCRFPMEARLRPYGGGVER